MLKLRAKQIPNYSEKNLMEECVLLRRFLVHFNQKSEALLKFYTAIHQSIAKEDLFFKIREYMFRNGIVFKKAELNELI